MSSSQTQISKCYKSLIPFDPNDSFQLELSSNADFNDDFDGELMSLNTFKFDNRTIKSKVDLSFNYEQKNSIYYLTNEDLKIYINAKSFKELINELHKEFFFLWDVIVASDDSDLEENTIQYKNILKNILYIQN